MTRGACQAESTALCSEDESNVGRKHRMGEKQGVWGETGGREARTDDAEAGGPFRDSFSRDQWTTLQTLVCVCLFICLLEVRV